MDRPKTKDNTINIRMSDDMVELLDKLSVKFHWDRSRLIRYLIREQATRLGIEVKEDILYEST